MDPILSIVAVVSAPLVVLGVVELVYFPLAVSFEHRRRHTTTKDWRPLVTIVVPAFNEGRVLANCVDSLLADDYPHKDVVLVDDGSTDDTLAVMRRYEDRTDVLVVTQPNLGKAGALNAGIAHATGEVLFFVDADGIFTPATITTMLGGFDNQRVGAVCGNDEPVNLDRIQTRLLALLTHGTAFIRRALARIGLLTIVSGNIGAFRRSVIDEVGPFAVGSVGEDLELTWRVHRAGHLVSFCPTAIVYSEVPSTLSSLWTQRVRWTRGLIQTARAHHDMLGRPRYGRVGWYLPFNLVTMLVVPVVQIVVVALLAGLAVLGRFPLSAAALIGIGLVGIAMALLTIVVAVALDRAWSDLRYLLVLPLWPAFSLMMSLVVAYALVLEARSTPARWNKFARTGVVSREGLDLVDVERRLP